MPESRLAGPALSHLNSGCRQRLRHPRVQNPSQSHTTPLVLHVRNAPKNAYREFEAQPATITPYTPIDVIAKI